jgi:hypothetical protein
MNKSALKKGINKKAHSNIQKVNSLLTSAAPFAKAVVNREIKK